jgi:penicillin-binding protein 2
MSKEYERQSVFNRRVAMVAAAQLALFGALGARLGYLQLVKGDHYAALAEQNRIDTRLVVPPRGEITDRFGVPLAINIQNFQVYLTREQAKKPEVILARLVDYIPLTLEEREEALKIMKKTPSFIPILVKENISWEEMAKLELHLPELPGTSVEEGLSRYYPFGEATAHVIGYVSRPSEKELTDDPIMLQKGFRIGKTGIEQQFDMPLRGLSGAVDHEVNVKGRSVRALDVKKSQEGERLKLTLDAELQMACQERLAREQSASAVVMDVHNGAVYALCSHPAYDPNSFSKGIPSQLWRELMADERAPLTNKVIAGQYPPGSTFKMVTALAALEAGVATEDTHVFCRGHYMLGNTRFHCWKKTGHGSMNVVSALEQSCDTYFYEISRRLGIDKIAAMARRLGLDEKTGIELPHEMKGLMPDQAWKKRVRQEQWHSGETLNASIGQGAVLTTPLQLAVMTARLVNGGRAVIPTLIEEESAVDKQTMPFVDLGLNKEHVALMIEGMNAVCNEKMGKIIPSAGKQARRRCAELRPRCARRA